MYGQWTPSFVSGLIPFPDHQCLFGFSSHLARWWVHCLLYFDCCDRCVCPTGKRFDERHTPVELNKNYNADHKYCNGWGGGWGNSYKGMTNVHAHVLIFHRKCTITLNLSSLLEEQFTTWCLDFCAPCFDRSPPPLISVLSRNWHSPWWSWNIRRNILLPTKK